MEQTNFVHNYLQNVNIKYQFLNKPDSENKFNHNKLPEDIRLLSINKASKILGIRYETVKKLVRTGRIKAVMTINNKYKISYKSLVEFVNGTINTSVKQKDLVEVTQNKIEVLIKEISD